MFLSHRKENVGNWGMKERELGIWDIKGRGLGHKRKGIGT